MLLEVIIATIIVAATAFVVQFYLKGREWQKTKKLEEDLEVPATYQWEEYLIDQTEDLYFDELEKVEAIYCEENKIGPDEPLDRAWPSKCSEDLKSNIKMRLMERAMAWVYVYRKMEAQLKKSYPLWRQNMIAPTYWTSLKAAEEKLEKQFAEIKKESAMIDPASQHNIEIFREACRIIDSYGYPPKIPEKGAAPKAGGPPGQADAPVLKISDGKTFEITQGPDDAELLVALPRETEAKTLKVDTTADSIEVKVDGKTLFTKKLKPEALIAAAETTWTLSKKMEYEPGDIITLEGLGQADLNGKKGVILKPTEETIRKQRVRVELSDKRSLSIKPVNIVNHNKWRKTAVLVSMEKATKKAVWPMPPFAEGKADSAVQGS